MPGPVTLPYVFGTQPSGNVPASYLDSNFNELNSGLTAPLQSYLAGFQMSNDATTPNSVLDITAGLAADSTNANYIQTTQTFYASTGGSWVAGAGTSGSPVNKMGVGLTVANSTWYHVFAIINSGAADVYFDTSVTAANAPSGTTAFRRIGSFKTDGSAHILAFVQHGDTFLWSVAPIDQNGVSQGTTAANYAVSVPSGVSVTAIIRALAIYAGNASLNVYSPLQATESSQTTQGAGSSLVVVVGSSGDGAAGQFQILTDTSQHISALASVNSVTMSIVTDGWIDTRGKDN